MKITIPLCGRYKRFTLHKIILVHLIQLSSSWRVDLRRAAQKHQREAQGKAGKKSWSSLWSNVDHKMEPRIIFSSSFYGLRSDNRASETASDLASEWEVNIKWWWDLVFAQGKHNNTRYCIIPEINSDKYKKEQGTFRTSLHPGWRTTSWLRSTTTWVMFVWFNHVQEAGTEGPLKGWCLTKVSRRTSAPWRRCSSAPQHRACPPPPAVTTLWLHEPLDTAPWMSFRFWFKSQIRMTSRPSHTASSAQASCTCRRPPVIPPPSPWRAPQGCQCTCIAAVAWPSITPVRFVTHLFEYHIA